jgi:uncharacterized protein YbaP (TraB family)
MLKKLSIIWLFAAWATQAFSQTATQASSLLWKIEGKGLSKPSYLYGTMHSKKKQVYEFNQVVLDKINECDAFVGELALEPENMEKAAKLFLLPEGKSLSKLLKKEDYEYAAGIFSKETGMDLQLFDRLQPAYVLVMMSSGDLIKGEMKDALDQYLYNFAKSKGKKTDGLETIEEQAAALGSLSIDEQVKYFVDGIKKFDKEKDKLNAEQDKLLNLYLKSDIEAMEQMVQKQDDASMPKKMREALVNKRNVKMADRFSDRIKKTSTFAAVGAAHLGGKEGVIALLRKKGYTVTAVPCAFDGSALKQMTDATAQPSAASSSAGNKNITSTWHYYESPNGGYTIYFPVAPSERNQTLNDEEGRPITAYLTMVQEMSSGKTYTSSYTDLAEEVKSSPETDAKLRKQLEDQISVMKGKITEEKEVKVGPLKGKEYVIDIMGMMEMRVRKAYKGKRVYSLACTYMKTDELGKAEAGRFIESFNLK